METSFRPALHPELLTAYPDTGRPTADAKASRKGSDMRLCPARDQRRLAAIVAADVAGYSLLIGRDDSATLAGLRAHRRDLIDPTIAGYGGRIVKTTGDGLLLEFGSVVDAVRCAVDVQRGMAQRNAGAPAEQRIDFRIGINAGEIIIENGDVFGDCVNVAARLQELAQPGGICVSGRVHEDAHGKLDVRFDEAGERQLKNIARPVRIYQVALGNGPGRAMLGSIAASTPLLSALVDSPPIAVMPCNDARHPSEAQFFTAVAMEEIINTLSRIRRLFVVARNRASRIKRSASARSEGMAQTGPRAH